MPTRALLLPARSFCILLLIILAAQIDRTCSDNSNKQNGGSLCVAAGGECRAKSACGQEEEELSSQMCRRQNFICCVHTDNNEDSGEKLSRSNKRPTVFRKKPNLISNSNLNNKNGNIAMKKSNSKQGTQLSNTMNQKRKIINDFSENRRKRKNPGEVASIDDGNINNVKQMKKVPHFKSVPDLRPNKNTRAKGDKKKKKGCKTTATCSDEGGKCRKTKKGCKNKEIGKKKLCGKKKCICCFKTRVPPDPITIPPPPVCENKPQCTENNGICIPNSAVCPTSEGFTVNYVRCQSSYCKCCMAPPATTKITPTAPTGPRYPECPKTPVISSDKCVTCGIVNGPRVSRVTGGVAVDIPQKYPWLVWIERDSRHWCGGSLINNQFVLTAGQCLCISCKILPAESLSIIIADHNRNSELDDVQGTTCKVKAEELFVHPDFITCGSSPHTNDLALIKLSSPLSLATESILKPICLPTSSDKTYLGDSTIVSGWGLTSTNSDFPDLPHEVNITVIDNSKCDNRFWYWNNTKMLCAGGTNQPKDACVGDAGAPLITELTQGRYYVIGIVSGGDPLCRGPGVYTRIDQYIEWIKKTADLSNICTVI